MLFIPNDEEQCNMYKYLAGLCVHWPSNVARQGTVNTLNEKLQMIDLQFCSYLINCEFPRNIQIKDVIRIVMK